jgi:hypothetical protein
MYLLPEIKFTEPRWTGACPTYCVVTRLLCIADHIPFTMIWPLRRMGGHGCVNPDPNVARAVRTRVSFHDVSEKGPESFGID